MEPATSLASKSRSRPFACRRVDPARARALRALAFCEDFTAELDEVSWSFSASEREPYAGQTMLTASIDWAGAQWRVRGDSQTWHALLSAQLGPISLDLLEPDLKCALVQDVIEGVWQAGAAGSRFDVPVLRDFGAGDDANPIAEVTLAFKCTCASTCGYLFISGTSVRALQAVAAQCAPRHVHTDTRERWNNLPVPIRLNLGDVHIPLGTLRSLRVHDILIPDSFSISGTSRRLLMRAGPGFAWWAVMEEGKLNTTSEIAMEQSSASISATDEGDGSASPVHAEPDWESLPVKITFDLGERVLPFGELMRVRSGHIWELDAPVGELIQLRVNGARVGEGELVEIDGRPAVSVTRLTAPRT